MRVAIARVVAQDLADVGIEAELVPLELGTLLARLNAGDFDAAILQIPELTEPNTLARFLHSDAMPPYGANRARVNDAIVDMSLFEGDAVLDPAERRAAYKKLEDRVMERGVLDSALARGRDRRDERARNGFHTERRRPLVVIGAFAGRS